MYNNLIEYQQRYFSALYNMTDLEFGYVTQSPDLEYINANSIIVTEVIDDVITSVCSLLATNIHTTKIQIPRGVISVGDEEERLYLVRYQSVASVSDKQLEIIGVDQSNYSKYLELSNQLQIQEYGKVYKTTANQWYLDQDRYQMYMISYQGQVVGEFIFIQQLQAIESLIILEQYQRQGIGHQALKLASKQFGPIYLSADNSSIDFYQAIGAEIIDHCDVTYIYGNSRNLLMYLSFCI